jgi:hypothetical protein
MIKFWLKLGCFSLLLFASAVFAAVDLFSKLTPLLAIERFGIYQPLGETDQSFNASSTAGYDSVMATRLLRQTTVIPLRRGLVFGFNYVLDDVTTSAEWVELDVKIRHPATVNYLGHESTGFATSSAARLKADGRYRNGFFYVLSEPREMVAGEWTITLSYGGQVSVSKTFTVVAAQR